MRRNAAGRSDIMPRGGARARSGPQPDEGSGRSEARDFKLHGLPAVGYAGEVPDLSDFLPDATSRQSTIWSQLWSTPQAHAWSEQAWRWPVVADLAMWMARSQDPDAPIGTATNVKQLREECGIGATGLKLNGWKIADAPTPAPESAPVEGASVTNIKDRLPNGGA